MLLRAGGHRYAPAEDRRRPDVPGTRPPRPGLLPAPWCMCEERSLLRHYLSAVYTPEGVDVVMTSPLRDFASRTVNDVLRAGSNEDISHLMGWADSAATAGGDVTDSGQERAAANLAYHGTSTSGMRVAMGWTCQCRHWCPSINETAAHRPPCSTKLGSWPLRPADP